MSGPTLVAAALLSLAPLGLAAWSAVDLAGLSRLGLCLLPWVALAGLPRGSGRAAAELASAEPGHSGGSAAGLAAPLGLALPSLALGARLDRLEGAPLESLLGALLLGLVLVAILAQAARLARGAALHGLVWLALVPALPLLRAALGQAASPNAGRPPDWLERLADLSPLAWVLDWTAEGGLARPEPGLPWGPFLAAGLCLGAALARRRPGAQAGAPAPALGSDGEPDR